MSLDVYLIKRSRLELFTDDKDEGEEVFSQNITHNLGSMAKEAGIYYHVWRPEEISIRLASELIKPLGKAIRDMENRPDHYKLFDSPNGWGLYDNFLPWLKRYLEACQEYPDSEVNVYR